MNKNTREQETESRPEDAQASEQVKAVIRRLQSVSIEYKYYDTLNRIYINPDDFALVSGKLKSIDLDGKISDVLNLDRIITIRKLQIKDRYDTNLYQGDIIKFEYADYAVPFIIYIIDESDIPEEGFEIIGNIFENPELLTHCK